MSKFSSWQSLALAVSALLSSSTYYVFSTVIKLFKFAVVFSVTLATDGLINVSLIGAWPDLDFLKIRWCIFSPVSKSILNCLLNQHSLNSVDGKGSTMPYSYGLSSFRQSWVTYFNLERLTSPIFLTQLLRFMRHVRPFSWIFFFWPLI